MYSYLSNSCRAYGKLWLCVDSYAPAVGGTRFGSYVKVGSCKLVQIACIFNLLNVKDFR